MGRISQLFASVLPVAAMGLLPINAVRGQTTASTSNSPTQIAQVFKPAAINPSNSSNKATAPEPEVPVIMEAGDYSKGRPVVAIAILKGTKEEAINKKTGKPFTGEEIGEYFVKKLSTQGVPKVPLENLKVFVRQGKGDYTGVAFLVNDHLVGDIYPVDQAQLSIGAVSHVYNMEWGFKMRYPDAPAPAGSGGN